MHIRSLIPALAFPALSLAFIDASPTYLDPSNVYEVTSVETAPASYKLHLEHLVKQATLVAPSDQGSITTSTSSTSSSPTSVNWTNGMAFVKADTSNEAYCVNITIDNVEYPLLIDTGSPYVWLYDSNCTDTSCENKQLYTVSKNEDATSTFDLAYNTGSASGVVVTDDVTVAGLSAENYRFGAAKIVPDIFEQYSFEGVLGLPSANSSSPGLTNIVSFWKNNSAVDDAKFALCLGSYSTSKDTSNDGLIVFGKDVENLYKGEIYYSDVIDNSNNFWEVQIDGVYVEDYQVSFTSAEVGSSNSSTKRLGLIDSGTTSIVANSEDALKLHSFFENSITDGENFAVYCNSTTTLKFQIAGHNWTLSSDQYLGEAYAQDSEHYGYCVSNIQGSQTPGEGTWILGSLFLKNYYLSFDVQEKQIGIAQRNTNVEIQQSTSKTASTSTTSAKIATSTFRGSFTNETSSTSKQTSVRSFTVSSNSTHSSTSHSHNFGGQILASPSLAVSSLMLVVSLFL